LSSAPEVPHEIFIYILYNKIFSILFLPWLTLCIQIVANVYLYVLLSLLSLFSHFWLSWFMPLSPTVQRAS
jgi:hypothetical protein